MSFSNIMSFHAIYQAFSIFLAMVLVAIAASAAGIVNTSDSNSAFKFPAHVPELLATMTCPFINIGFIRLAGLFASPPSSTFVLLHFLGYLYSMTSVIWQREFLIEIAF
jgi:hypothetical protein